MQQQQYEKDLDLKSFLGYEFGGAYTNGTKRLMSNVYNDVLARPFRLFSNVSLTHSELNHMYMLELRTNTVNVSAVSISNEVDRLAAIMSRTYQIELTRASWGNYRVFGASSNLCFEIESGCDLATGKGRICLRMVNDKIKTMDDLVIRNQKQKENKLKEREVASRSVVIDIAEDEGADMLTASTIVKPIPSHEPKAASPVARLPGLSHRPALGGTLRARRLLRQKESMRSEIMQDPIAHEKSAKKRLENAQKEVDQLNSIKEKTLSLSDDAKKLYEANVVSATNELANATAALKEIEEVLTPEARAEFERVQKEKEEAEVRRSSARKEYAEFLKGAGVECDAVERLNREAERAEQRQQLLAIQEELKRVREAKAEDSGKRVAE